MQVSSIMKERIEKLNEIWGQLPPSRKLGLGVAILGILGLSAAILSWSGGFQSHESTREWC